MEATSNESQPKACQYIILTSLSQLFMYSGYFGVIIPACIAVGASSSSLAVNSHWLYFFSCIYLANSIAYTIGLEHTENSNMYGLCVFLFWLVVLLIANLVLMILIGVYAGTESDYNNNGGYSFGLYKDVETKTNSIFSLDQEKRYNIQENFQCCGINLKSLYETVSNYNITDILYGPECDNATINYLSSIIDQYPEYNQDVQAIIDNNPLIGQGSEGFFCIYDMINESMKNVRTAYIILSVFMGIELFSIYCVVALLCFVKDFEGGFKAVEERIVIAQVEPDNNKKDHDVADGMKKNIRNVTDTFRSFRNIYAINYPIAEVIEEPNAAAPDTNTSRSKAYAITWITPLEFLFNAILEFCVMAVYWVALILTLTCYFIYVFFASMCSCCCFCDDG